MHPLPADEAAAGVPVGQGRKSYRHVCLVCYRAKSLARYHRAKGERGSKLWRPNESELAIIREHYPLGGSSACMALIPGKTRTQIQQVARPHPVGMGEVDPYPGIGLRGWCRAVGDEGTRLSSRNSRRRSPSASRLARIKPPISPEAISSR